MNKRQLEVQKATIANEKKIIQQLKRVYSQASKDCDAKIRELAGRTDMENLQSIIYQQQYQQALKKQLDTVLDTLQTDSFDSIAEYLGKSYEDGFFGTLYDLHGQGIPLIFPIDQRQVVEAIKTDAKLSKSLYSRLGEDVDYLKKSIRAELSRGISNGSTWVDMAYHIANGMNSPFNRAMNNAMRIARTEGHRIQNKAQWNTLNHARNKGADIVKQWDSTLDKRTRKTHQRLDGQIRELDEPFEVNGKKAMMPGGFGIPSEDIHCRCCMLQRARWALDDEELQTLKNRAAYYGLDKTKDFEDYKSKYKVAVEKEKQQQDNKLYPASLAGVKRGDVMTHEEADTGRTNPHYRKDNGYRINCQSCVVNYEARRRGYNVQTLPNKNNPTAKKLSYDTNLAWIDPATGKNPPTVRSGSKTAKQFLNYIKDNTEEGNRYTLQFYWRDYNGGHIIHAYKENGEVVLYDPQVPVGYEYTKGDKNLLAYFKRIQYRSYGRDVSPNLLRVDNLIIDPDIAKGIMEGVK